MSNAKHTPIEMMRDEATQILFEYATTRGDRFRQWFYPHLPTTYVQNPKIPNLIQAGIERGLSAQQIADEIYKEHA